MMFITKTLSDDNNTLSISIRGAFDFSIVNDFHDSYINIQPIPKIVILDFRDTLHIDSSALGMLLNLKKHINGDFDSIKITNIRSGVKNILTLAHFEKMFELV